MGLPVPPGPAVADLTFRFGAEEVEAHNPFSHELLKTRLPDLTLVSREEFKRTDAGAKFVVRTGEATRCSPTSPSAAG